MNRKFIIRLYSGTGNELFIYAFYRYLIIKHNLNVYLDIKSGTLQSYGANPEGTILTLSKFRAKYKIVRNKFFFLGLIGKLKRFFYKKLYKNNFYITEKKFCINLNKILNGKSKFKYLDGFFQNKIYADSIYKYLIKEIKPKKRNKYFEDLKNKINFNKSLCVGYRDFGLENNSVVRNLDKIVSKSRFKNKKIYIFTNNMHGLLKLSKKLNYENCEEIKFNYKKNSVYALDLMKNFRIFIIGSSTFHWWGAYLAKKPKEIYLTNKIHKPIQTKEMKLIF
jgi:hypothetical protein